MSTEATALTEAIAHHNCPLGEVRVVSVALEASAAWVVLVVSVERVASAALAVSAVLAAWVVQATGRRNSRPVVAATAGSTILPIAAARRIGTAPPPTDLAGRPAEIHCLTVRPMPGSRLTVRVGVWAAIAEVPGATTV
jgi:hypothetical protein